VLLVPPALVPAWVMAVLQLESPNLAWLLQRSRCAVWMPALLPLPVWLLVLLPLESPSPAWLLPGSPGAVLTPALTLPGLTAAK
jgi:hypothetical protein